MDGHGGGCGGFGKYPKEPRPMMSGKKKEPTRLRKLLDLGNYSIKTASEGLKILVHYSQVRANKIKEEDKK